MTLVSYYGLIIQRSFDLPEAENTKGQNYHFCVLYVCLLRRWGDPFLSFVVPFLLRHFPGCAFNGRLQLGCHGQTSVSILPIFTCDYDCFISFLSDFIFFPYVDYYLSVNSVSGVSRHSSDLFSLHNLVIDIDCHDVFSLSLRDFLLDCLSVRFTISLFDTSVPMPTTIVNTGRGLQLWWSIAGISANFKSFYDEVLDYYISSLSEVLVDGSLDDFSMFQVDVGASKNVVGYFRLPCTMNRKTNTLVTYTECAGTYELMDLF